MGHDTVNNQSFFKPKLCYFVAVIYVWIICEQTIRVCHLHGMVSMRTKLKCVYSGNSKNSVNLWISLLSPMCDNSHWQRRLDLWADVHCFFNTFILRFLASSIRAWKCESGTWVTTDCCKNKNEYTKWGKKKMRTDWILPGRHTSHGAPKENKVCCFVRQNKYPTLCAKLYCSSQLYCRYVSAFFCTWSRYHPNSIAINTPGLVAKKY